MKNIEWLKLWVEGHALEYMEAECKIEAWWPMQRAEECVAVPGPAFSDRFVFRKAQPKQYLYVFKPIDSGSDLKGYTSQVSPEVFRESAREMGINFLENDYLIFGQEVRT